MFSDTFSFMFYVNINFVKSLIGYPKHIRDTSEMLKILPENC